MTEQKRALRRIYKGLRDGMDARQRRQESRRIAEHILGWAPCAAAREVFAYRSMGSEADTEYLIDCLLAQRKSVSLPRVLDQSAMAALRYRGGDRLERSRYGAYEPALTSEEVPPGQIDLILVPALAATPQGVRLGYGGGYYDRFLTRSRGVKIALCLSNQVVDSLPFNGYDIRMDYLATPQGIAPCGRRIE